MIRDELITAVHDAMGREPSRSKAGAIVDAMLAAIRKGLQDDGSVQIQGFGSFQITTRKARTGRNPATGEPIEIPESKTVTFKPGKNLKEGL